MALRVNQWPPKIENKIKKHLILPISQIQLCLLSPATSATIELGTLYCPQTRRAFEDNE
jgi:hypothetical protein